MNHQAKLCCFARTLAGLLFVVHAAPLAIAAPPTLGQATTSDAFRSDWHSDLNRRWVGPQYWANRLQDWRVNDGRLECVNARLPMRTVHLLTRRISQRHGVLASLR